MAFDKVLWREIETKFVCIGIPLLGLAILTYHLPTVNPLANYSIIVLMIINVFADLLSVPLPSGVNVSLSYPIMICSLILYGPAATMWVYVPGSLFVQITRKKEPFKVVFNVTQIAIPVFIAGFFLKGGSPEIVITRDILRIFLAVLTFDLINFSQVIKVITLLAGGSFRQALKDTWFQELATVRPIYYASGIIMAVCFQAQGILGGMLVVAPVLGAFFQLSAQNELKSQRSRANTDALTGLSNRYALSNWWQRELPGIINNSKTLSVIMIDIDDFKKVNDRYGHDVGDMVLRQVADILRECVRRTDCIFRFGGEEFVVLLPESDSEGAQQVAERIRSTIQKTQVSHLDHATVTVSAGLSCLTRRIVEEKEDIPSELLRRADNAMYVAKQSGKNQIHVYN